jgi:ATP-dependent Clp protease protease subunit
MNAKKAPLSKISKQACPVKRSNDVEVQYEDSIEDNTSRTIFLIGDIDEEIIKVTAERLITLSELDYRKPINLIINTNGGSVEDTFMLYDLIKYVPTPIHTVGLGKIMSAGCLLLASGEKGKRLIGKNARLMYHVGTSEHEGNIFEIRSHLEAFERQEKQYDKLFAFETGMTLENVEKLYNKHGPTMDTYITPSQAIKLGIVDSFIESKR